MPTPFVWFDNISSNRAATSKFLTDTFGWQQQDIGPMTFQVNGDAGPFAATCEPMDHVSGWVPYVEVDDLDAETEKAKANGAEIIAQNLSGPAGVATFIRDPGGAPLALWKRGPGF